MKSCNLNLILYAVTGKVTSGSSLLKHTQKPGLGQVREWSRDERSIFHDQALPNQKLASRHCNETGMLAR